MTQTIEVFQEEAKEADTRGRELGESEEEQQKRKQQEEEEMKRTIKPFVRAIGEINAVKRDLQQKQRDLQLIGEEDIEEFYNLLGNIVQKWPKLSTIKRKLFLGFMVKEIEIEFISPHWVRLTTEWLPSLLPRPDVCFIWRQYPQRAAFESWEKEIIRTFYASCMSKKELLQRLPTKTWGAIRNAAKKLDISKKIDAVGDFPENACWSDAEVLGAGEGAIDIVREACEASAQCGKKRVPLQGFWLGSADLGELQQVVHQYKEDTYALSYECMAVQWLAVTRPCQPCCSVSAAITSVKREWGSSVSSQWQSMSRWNSLASSKT
jgi:hypothetical protein